MSARGAKLVIALIIAALAMLFAVKGMYVAFALTVLVGIAVANIVSRALASRSWEPDFDERDKVIEALAARALLKVVTIGGGLMVLAYAFVRGLGIVAVPPWLDRLARDVAYVLCSLLMIWLPLYAYYRWRMGG